MTVTAEEVKKLRDRTGAGFMECKAALTEAGGDMEEASTILRKRGLASAAKKAGRTTSQGLVASYIHMGKDVGTVAVGAGVGVLVEVNCESDFVARTEAFQLLAKNIAMQIAAAEPKYVRRDEIPAETLERERAIYRAQFEGSGKPAAIVDKIVEGKLESFYAQVVLLDQPTIHDESVKVSQLIAETSAKVGEAVAVRRFVRFKLGEATA